MYILIGSDQREYGPINEAVVNQWIHEGRANAVTKVRREAEGNWSTLGALPEFTGAIELKTTRYEAALFEDTGDPDVLAERVIARGVSLDVGGCFRRSWTLFKSRPGTLIGVFVVFAVIQFLLGLIPIAGSVIGALLGGVLSGGVFFVLLKALRGGRPGVGEMFSGFTLAFVPLMLGGLVVTLLTMAGFLLLIIPGIYLIVAWSLTFPLIIDKKLDFWAAMELGRKVVHKVWWPMFVLLFAAGLLVLAGLLVFGVGVLVTGPVAWGAMAWAYEDLFGEAIDEDETDS